MASSTTLFLVLALFFVSCYTSEDGLAIDRMEKECIMQGGLCSRISDCPEGHLSSIKGLCPKQREMGVECCYAAPKTDSTKCEDMLGECMPWCNRVVRIPEATDCGADSMCCLLVN